MVECILADINMPKVLMIIGAGAEQVPAYEAAKDRGLIVVGTDLNPNAPGLAIADYSLIASTRDPFATLAAARDFNNKLRIDGVMTIANDVPYTVALVAKELNLPGISIEAAKTVSNKLLMKNAFVEHNVPCPWFRDIANPTQLADYLKSEKNERFVLKPVDGRGARGVLLIKYGDDTDWAFSESMRWGDGGGLILEKFIPGLQLSTESFLINGDCHTLGIAERNYEFIERFSPYIIENGGTMPPELSDAVLKKIDSVIIMGAAALGVRDGVVKGDLIVTPNGEVVVVELALRLSGGWFATHQIPAASGINILSVAISYALGESINKEVLIAKHKRATAIRYWFPPSGLILHIQGEDSLHSLPGLISYGFFRQEGDLQPNIKMHSDRFGFLIVQGKDRDEVLSRVDAGMKLINIKVNESGQ